MPPNRRVSRRSSSSPPRRWVHSSPSCPCARPAIALASVSWWARASGWRGSRSCGLRRWTSPARPRINVLVAMLSPSRTRWTRPDGAQPAQRFVARNDVRGHVGRVGPGQYRAGSIRLARRGCLRSRGGGCSLAAAPAPAQQLTSTRKIDGGCECAPWLQPRIPAMPGRLVHEPQHTGRAVFFSFEVVRSGR